jgi:hypothetical protein
MEGTQTLTGTMEELAGIRRDELQSALGELSDTIPARPLAGVLPVARVIPQDVHSVMDYVGGAALIAAGVASGVPAACTAGIAMGAGSAGASLMTDYRLSLAKLIPIEVHEVLDYVTGVSAIAAPFLFGYRRRSKLATIAHVAVGLTIIVGSLFTDYRAVRGTGRWARRV